MSSKQSLKEGIMSAVSGSKKNSNGEESFWLGEDQDSEDEFNDFETKRSRLTKQQKNFLMLEQNDTSTDAMIRDLVSPSDEKSWGIRVSDLIKESLMNQFSENKQSEKISKSLKKRLKDIRDDKKPQWEKASDYFDRAAKYEATSHNRGGVKLKQANKEKGSQAIKHFEKALKMYQSFTLADKTKFRDKQVRNLEALEKKDPRLLLTIEDFKGHKTIQSIAKTLEKSGVKIDNQIISQIKHDQKLLKRGRKETDIDEAVGNIVRESMNDE